MSWVAAGVAVVGGGIQIAQGVKQQRQGRAMEEGLDKPNYTIPPEIARNLRDAEMRSFQGLPDEQKSAFLDNQQRAAQAAMRSSSDRRGGLGMISQIQSQQDRSSLQMLQQDVAARDKNIERAMQARNVMASYRDKRFQQEYNEFSADLDYARAQVGAGMQNVAGGLITAASAVQTGMAYSDGSFGDGISRSDKRLFEQQQKNNLPGTTTTTDNITDNIIETTKETEISGSPNAVKNFLTGKNIPLNETNDQVFNQPINFDGNVQNMSRADKNFTKQMLELANDGDPRALNWISQNLGDKIEGGSTTSNLPSIFKKFGVKYKLMK